jgi:hypothetical protein
MSLAFPLPAVAPKGRDDQAGRGTYKEGRKGNTGSKRQAVDDRTSLSGGIFSFLFHLRLNEKNPPHEGSPPDLLLSPVPEGIFPVNCRAHTTKESLL